MTTLKMVDDFGRHETWWYNLISNAEFGTISLVIAKSGGKYIKHKGTPAHIEFDDESDAAEFLLKWG